MYVVYIVYGKGGWFSELENEMSGSPIIPRNVMKETREAYFAHFSHPQYPSNPRAPIEGATRSLLN